MKNFSAPTITLLSIFFGIVVFFGFGAMVSAQWTWNIPWMTGGGLDSGFGTNGFTEADAKAAIAAIISGEFGNPAFIDALLDYMSDPLAKDPVTGAAPKSVSLADLYSFIQKNYSSIANSAQGQQAADVLQHPGSAGSNYNSDYNSALTAAQQKAATENAATSAAKAAAQNNLITSYQAKVESGDVTSKDRDNFVKAMQALGDTYIPPAGGIGTGILYTSYDASDPKNTKGKNMVDTSAQFELNTGYDSCLDGFDQGGPSSGSDNSNSGNNGNNGTNTNNNTNTNTDCTSFTYGAWGDCVNSKQVRTIATQSPSGCSNTGSAVLSQSCTNAKPVVTNTTNANQTSASPILSVSTDRAASCQYNSAGGFTYGSGTTFSTTGNYNHNSTLSGLANGQQTYYVVCKDNLSGGMSDTLKIVFTVDLSLDPNNAPVVASTTPSTQTSATPTLSVTTDRPATCQYSQNATTTSSFIAMTTSDSYSHSVSISSLADATYTFYVVCKDKTTAAASAAKQIITTLSRSVIAGAPVVTNTTASYQTTGSPILSVTTDSASTCQYSRSYFAYGNGTLFTTDGSTSHSVQLSGLVSGQYNYYVICQRTSNSVASAAGFQIVFTVNIGTVTNTCANLSSNDRENDGDRSNAGNTSGNSVYPWQAVETGTREKFTKVDWYAGYQFTPNKDGQVTQLCGYFDSGVTNKVSLYNGSYTTLTSAEITGNGSWQCVNVSPAAVSTDSRYYVIARVQSNPIYFEYKSGLFPKNSGNVTIEAGIRQTVIDSQFMTAIVKYDYMTFGLVDVRISYAQTSAAGPAVSSVVPVGTVSGSSTTISAQTDAGATCRFDRDDVGYDDMSYSLPSTSSGVFSQKVCGLENGSYTFYVRCKSAGGTENNSSTLIQFQIAN